MEINIGGVPEHFNLPWQLAIENGLFEERGLNIKWHSYPAGTGAMAYGIKEGKLDMAVMITEGLVYSLMKGLDAKIVKGYVNSPLIWGIHTAAKSIVSDPWNSESYKYAISRLGSGSHLMAMIDAGMHGRKIRANQFVPVENLEGAVKSLTKNETQLFYWEKYTTKYLVDTSVLRRVGEFVTPWPCFFIAAGTKSLNQKGKEIAAVLQVINFTCKHFMSASNLIEMLSERHNMPVEDASDWLNNTAWSTNNIVHKKVLNQVMDALKKVGQIERTTDPENLCDIGVDLI